VGLHKIDVNFINPFVSGVLETFQVQCSLPTKYGKPFLKGQGQEISVELAAVIELKSPTFNGSISLCFTRDLFMAVMKKMLGDSMQGVANLDDGASELLNIIFGQAKKVLNQKGYSIDKAIPTIVKGNALETRKTKSAATLVLPFESDHGVFHLEVAAD
jgi:chemotaxis protein CheX